MNKAGEKYLMLATSDDVLADARLNQYRKKAKEVKRNITAMKDAKAAEAVIDDYAQANNMWIAIDGLLTDSLSTSKKKANGIGYWKNQLRGDGKSKDVETMEKIRRIRENTLQEVNRLLDKHSQD